MCTHDCIRVKTTCVLNVKHLLKMLRSTYSIDSSKTKTGFLMKWCLKFMA